MGTPRELRSLVAAADLPPGRLVDRTVLGSWREPLLWRADESAGPESWERMLPVRERTGLCPVLLGRHSHGPSVEDDLLPQAVSDVDGIDADSTLAGWWEDRAAPDGGPDGGTGGPTAVRERAGSTALRPYGARWPGPAPPAAQVGDPDTAAAGLARSLVAYGTLREPRIALVPARRSADVLAAIGWTGTLAYGEGPAPYSAVLRSWEDRFGIRVVALELDVLHLSVPSPPRTPAEALPIAAEHFAFCPAVVRQGAGTLAHYAEKWLPGKEHWTFWWD